MSPREIYQLLLRVSLLFCSASAFAAGPAGPDPIPADASIPNGIAWSYRQDLAFPIHNGPLLNLLSNGVQDYGEVGIDCGGVRNDPCDVKALEVNLVVDSQEVLQIDPKFTKFELTLNGRAVTLIANTTEESILLKVNPATRPGNSHSTANVAALEYNFLNSDYGFSTVIIDDFFGQQPVPFSLEGDALVADKLIKPDIQSLLGVDFTAVINNGFSYGAGLSFVSHVANAISPYLFNLFDGGFVSGAPTNVLGYLQWHQLDRLVARARGEVVLLPYWSLTPDLSWNVNRYFTGGMTLRDYHIENITNSRMTIINGQVDSIVEISPLFDAFSQSYDQNPTSKIVLRNVPEAGHGDPLSIETSLSELSSFVTALDGDSRPNLPSPEAKIDLSSYVLPHEAFLSSPRSISHGALLSEKWHKGIGVITEVVGIDAGSREDLIVGTASGQVYRFKWDNLASELVQVWRANVGMGLTEILTDDLAGNGNIQVFVGTQQGLWQLNGSDGSVEKISGYGVQTITTGELFPNSNGKELVYTTTQDGVHLVVESASGQELVNTPFTTFSKLVVRNNELYGASLFGHVIKFKFYDRNNDWVPVAEMVSEYLSFVPRDLVWLESFIFVSGDTFAGGGSTGPAHIIDSTTGKIQLTANQVPASSAAEQVGNFIFLKGASSQYLLNLLNLTTSPITNFRGPVELVELRTAGESVFVNASPDGSLYVVTIAGELLGQIEGIGATSAVSL